jgi:hypothetical protein
MNKHVSFLCLFLISVCIYAQKPVVNDTITRVATIKNTTNGNEVVFTPETPTLNQIAGAPKAFYTYYWEFGDGNYSTDKNPKHIYKKEGDYEVKLWATNNYDTGKPPTTRPKKIAINSVSTPYNETASMDEDFILKRNREPVPNEEFVVILSYKNPKNYTTNGKLYLFYNEQKFKANNFELIDTRTYHNEKNSSTTGFVFTNNIDDDGTYLAASNNAFINMRTVMQDSTEKTNLPLTIEQSKSLYKNWSLLEFDNMQPKEERNIFFSLKTTP